MYKPKSISIKKVTQQMQPQEVPKSNLRNNSRKSLNPSKPSIDKSKTSPVEVAKRRTFEDEDDSVQRGNFIDCINGYLNNLDSGKSSKCSDLQLGQLKQKIKKEKDINRNLQKNIIEFQRILWQRTNKLQNLEEKVRRMEDKENIANVLNSQAKSTAKIINRQYGLDASSQYEHSQPSECSLILEKLQRRRKTELPAEIERMISQTMGVRPRKSRSRLPCD